MSDHSSSTEVNALQRFSTRPLTGVALLPITADASKPATLDWGGLVNVLHVGPGVNVTFDSLTTRGFASPYDPAAQQLTQAVVGQASWPTFTSEPGASARMCHAPARACIFHAALQASADPCTGRLWYRMLC
jgi:hypothetical protein